jgi:hypothetical protein
MSALGNDNDTGTGTGTGTTTSAMNTKEKLINLLLHEKDLPAEMKSKIDEQVEIFWKGITNSAGSFLRDLDDKKHTQEQVKTLVQCIPESLSHGEVDSMYIECADLRIFLPIHAAIWDLYHNHYNTKAISFIPLLAEEGAKLNVGGADRRGGLLYPNDDEENVLQLLVSCYSSEGYRCRPGLDSLCLNVMKSLREMELLQKDDIDEYKLLNYSLRDKSSKQRFEYLVDWYPEGLMVKYAFDPYINSAAEFKLVLKAGIKHFPQHISRLAFRYGSRPHEEKYKTWKIIQECIDEADPNTILERNQETNLHPFVTAAEGSYCYLDIVYYLLRKDPIVLDNCHGNVETRPHAASVPDDGNECALSRSMFHGSD